MKNRKPLYLLLFLFIIVISILAYQQIGPSLQEFIQNLGIGDIGKAIPEIPHYP